jgi:hypothetical protein
MKFVVRKSIRERQGELGEDNRINEISNRENCLNIG